MWRLFVETIPLAIVNIFNGYMRPLTSGDSLTAAVDPREERARAGGHRECGVATQRGNREEQPWLTARGCRERMTVSELLPPFLK